MSDEQPATEAPPPPNTPRPRARIKIRIEFSKEEGFEADAPISSEDAVAISALFWKAVADTEDLTWRPAHPPAGTSSWRRRSMRISLV